MPPYQDEAQEAIVAQRETLQEEIAGLNTRAGELQEVMTQLKGDLYGKFGNNINLEPEEEWDGDTIIVDILNIVRLGVTLSLTLSSDIAHRRKAWEKQYVRDWIIDIQKRFPFCYKKKVSSVTVIFDVEFVSSVYCNFFFFYNLPYRK